MKNSVIYQSGNALGIGTTSPAAEFDLRDTANSSFLYAISGTATNGGEIGVYGNNTVTTGGTIGVNGQVVSQTGVGVGGFHNSATGAGVGVAGISSSSAGYGVTGIEESGTGQTAGVVGDTYSENGVGVMGIASAGPAGNPLGVEGATAAPEGAGGNFINISPSGMGVGVAGYTNSTTGYAVYGIANSIDTTGVTFGVYGQNSTTGSGVEGVAYATSGTAYGVYGSSNSTSGDGVVGMSLADSGNANGIYGSTYSPQGVAGYFDNAGGGYILVGVVNEQPAHKFHVDGFGDGYFSGNLDVGGMLSKGGGSFKIDHPLDPANKYLYHSFVESSDMMNIYNGNVTTDANGLATVQLPDWFQALNTDFRYQLTVIGQFAQAIVASKVANNQFRIQTDKPNVEVSWQVTGIRQDAFANANRVQVEVNKAPADHRHYLHPESYGAPESARIGSGAAQANGVSLTEHPVPLPRPATPSLVRNVPPMLHPLAGAGALEVNQK